MKPLQNFPTSLSNWLDSRNWDYWYTVTFRDELSRASAMRAGQRLERQWMPHMHFYACEEGKRTGRHHLHGLLRWDGTDRLIKPQASEIWNFCYEGWGRSHVDKYDSELGATGYVAKYVSKELVEWNIQQ